MFTRSSPFFSSTCLSLALLVSSSVSAQTAGADGVVKVQSAYSMDETISRIKQDIAGKGIMFFSEVDQSRLDVSAGIALRRSTLLSFGNPALGSQFITSNPQAGLDWPVRLLVQEDDQGKVVGAFRFSDAVLRHLVVNMDEAVTEPSPMARAAEEEGDGAPRRRERTRDDAAPASDDDDNSVGEGA